MANGEAKDVALAKKVIRPDVMNAVTMHYFYDVETTTPIDINTRVAALSEQIAKVHAGDMSTPETMLMSQAFTLDALFGHLARKARNQDQLKHYETFLRLALRAQNQCRMTLETLSNIKNPPVIFAKQANINTGQQQINNGSVSHTAETQNQSNELLTEIPNATLDNRGTSEAISVNSNLEAVG
ncbi:MAG: hypothetical protein Q7U38_01975 [Methylobacter sp.]|nr:hypothetical protein [Methylobacter sp.]MDP2098012.1 hypothetical protein [Methylobacter sp.]MDP2427986.1 hypothetical protein [Methylobacter sp.]MDP3055797.1 hypothetical protein [Methylobacter sp.]MDP3363657.1 hypothetical protein [Methylobacter sp.]